VVCVVVKGTCIVELVFLGGGEHVVDLVNDKELHVIEFQRLPLYHVVEPAGGRHHHMTPWPIRTYTTITVL
jgi:hypothetical protein